MQSQGTIPSGLMPSGGQPQQPAGSIDSLQQASPEEQAQYEKFVSTALNFIFDERMLPQLEEILKGGGEPEQGLAKATALTVARVKGAAEKAGDKISGDVLLHAGTEIFENLADVSEAAGIKDYSKDSDALEGAFFLSMDEFRMLQQQSGSLDQNAAQQDMQMLQAMDESGQLEQVMRKLAAEDPRGNYADEVEQREQAGRGLMPGARQQ